MSDLHEHEHDHTNEHDHAHEHDHDHEEECCCGHDHDHEHHHHDHGEDECDCGHEHHHHHHDDDDEDEYEERRSPLIPILFAVGTAFVIATVFLVLLIVFKNLDVSASGIESVVNPSGGSTISVSDDNEFLMPNLVGMSSAAGGADAPGRRQG